MNSFWLKVESRERFLINRSNIGGEIIKGRVLGHKKKFCWNIFNPDQKEYASHTAVT